MKFEILQLWDLLMTVLAGFVRNLGKIMKDMHINLENYGGYDVDFPLSKIEFEMRVKTEVRCLSENPRGFSRKLRKSKDYVEKNVLKFFSIECCEGPEWDMFKAALIDEICKLTAKNYNQKEVFVL